MVVTKSAVAATTTTALDVKGLCMILVDVANIKIVIVKNSSVISSQNVVKLALTTLLNQSSFVSFHPLLNFK